jgi:hypothetical protein
MEAWARKLISKNHPKPMEVKLVAFVTERKRDTLFGDKI